VTDAPLLRLSDLGRLHAPIRHEMDAAVKSVIDRGAFILGQEVKDFEAGFAAYCGVSRAVGVDNGTSALELIFRALGIGPGDEVVVPAYTFPATANVVALAGARPRLVDVDPRTMNLDVAQVAEAIGPGTRAVLAVHLFGRPLDWDALRGAVPEEIPIVEDAAGALGARSKGRPCASLGVLGCLSFHPRKIVTTGEGGAVTTPEEFFADAVRRMRHHGIEPRGEFEIRAAGPNYRLSDILCAVGIPQVRRLDELLSARARIADGYAQRLEGVVETPRADDGDVHGWQAYVVQLDRRDEALAGLRAEGIEAQIGTYALHRLAAYRDQGPFPGADAAYERALALPFHTRLTDGDLDRVAAALRRFV
jgi:dTDP-4-amino-4,6-dideoxygalactose transaminase